MSLMSWKIYMSPQNCLTVRVIIFQTEKQMFLQILKYLNCLGIKSIILPTKIRTCGRPKGVVIVI